MSSRGRLVRILGVAQVALLIPLLECERRMRRAGGPGIIPFELAGTPEASGKIMRKWGDGGRRAARVSLVLDYPFLVTYSGLQLIGCTATSERLERRGAIRLGAAGRVIAPAQLAAGAFDAIENTSLLLILSGRDGRLPGLARGAALAKFALLTIGWSYRLLGLAAR